MEARRLLAIAYKVFKTLNDLNSNLMTEIFYLCPNLSHRKDNLYIHSRSPIKFRNKILRSIGEHIWNLLLENINKILSLQDRYVNSNISWKSGQMVHVNAFPSGIYLLKVNNRNTRTRCEISSKLTIKTPEQRQWRRSGVFIVNFTHISHLILMFQMLTSNASWVSYSS